MVSAQGYSPEESPEQLANRLKLPFKDISVLTRALTHRSYLNEHQDVLEDNERLEFLGDAILDFLVAAWLYNRFPEMAEGELTRLRAALVGTKQLAAFARRINIGSSIRLGRGEDEGGGRRRSSLLCATFEALIGAIYLDIGLDMVKEFIEPLLDPVAETIILKRQDRDYKSRLQEWTQSKGYGIPQYMLVSARGPDHERVFEIQVKINGKIYGSGIGSSKQSASKEAARLALVAFGLE